MPWGKIDDAFDDDPRVLRVLAHGEGPQALGLYLVCFSWANRCTRRKGRVPGLLPYHLPLSKMGRDAYRWAALLVDEHLWVPAEETRPEVGWVIVDFAASLPDDELRRKRADAGRRGAARRWGTGPGADPACAPAATQASPSSPDTASDQGVPGDAERFGPSAGHSMALCYSGDGKSHDLPMASSDLLSICHSDAPGTGGTMPSPHSNEPSPDGTVPSGVIAGDGADAPEFGTLLSLHGSLPLIDGKKPRSDSKTAPHTHTHTQEQKKTLSAPDGAGVIPLPFATPTSTETSTETTVGASRGKRGKTRAPYTPEFEAFWKAYGNRGAKPAAAAAWHEALTRATAAQIMAAVPAYLKANPEVRYRKHAERWLRGDMWLSANPAPPRSAGGNPFHNPTAAAYETSV